MSFDLHTYHQSKSIQNQNLMLQHNPKKQQPVYLNFHETVAVGESSFAVSVPRSWSMIQLPNGETLRREFKFTELNITPRFYSQTASVLGVDADSIVRAEDGSEDFSLLFAVGYSCQESLYFSEKPEGGFADSR
jgi:hypothetical protein